MSEESHRDGRPSLASRGTVVVVDDEPSVLRAFERALAGQSYDVAAFSSALEAVQRIAEGDVFALVSDITMPWMTGIDLLRTVREHDPDLPVILITGNPTVDSAASAIDYGAFRYLVKPVSPKELQQTVDKAVRLYRLAWTKRRALELMGVPGGAADRAGLEANFQRALASIWIAYQPIVNASDGTLFGYEALLRSDEPTLPGPGQVVDAAERLDALHELGRTIRERAARPMLEAADGVALFVNLHPEDLDDADLIDPRSALARIASRVVLELTERKSLGSIDAVRPRIEALRRMGFRIAVDDLGAGYAGLSSFALLEPEIVKLDMTLVRDVDSSPVKRKLVASMTALCKDMGMRVVAEGIETAPERDTLVELGCDLLQGYFFARPGPAFPSISVSASGS